MAENFEEVTVTLINNKVQFTGISSANPDRPITFDYKAPVGDGQGYGGLELLLMSLAGCSATAIVYLLRKMGKTVAGLSVQAKGIKSSQPPLKFEKIFLEYSVTSGDVQDADAQKALQLAEEPICPVWQMIKNNVEIQAGFSIISGS